MALAPITLDAAISYAHEVKTKRSKAKKDDVMAFDPDRRENDQLIADIAKLGYLRPDMKVLDCTYGLGVFWKLWRPDRKQGGRLVRTDLNPELSPDRRKGVDYRRMPFKTGEFNASVLDPHYQLNGTSTNKGPSQKDERYDTTRYQPWKERHAEINEALVETIRVTAIGGIVILKCQDQVSSGAMRWQTLEFTETARAHGATRKAILYVEGYRSQSRKVQLHPGSNISAGIIFVVKKRVDPAHPILHPKPFVPPRYQS